MKFLLQMESDFKFFSTDVYQMQEFCYDKKLNAHLLHSCIKLTEINFEPNHKEYIPVGSLEFVSKWLHRFHNVEHLNPIEVPEVLRKPEFLLRKYAICPKEELPHMGRFFFKCVESLKRGFAGVGELSDIETRFELKNGLYVISEPIEIASEFRVIVLNDNILDIRCYDGNPLIFPDSTSIKKMVLTYMNDTKRPKAYTLDVAVTPIGTAILEVHPFVSVGTYGHYSSDLPFLYWHGIEYYKTINKKLSRSEVK